jgi:AcrR family transcriptional regulator
VTRTIPSTRRAQIVETARRLLEERGPEALSMRNVASAIGIRAPSLYEHVADKRALESAIIAAALEELGGRQAEALAAKPADPLAAVCAAYRKWAHEHPHLYRLIFVRDLDRDEPAVAHAEQSSAVPIRAVCGGDKVASRTIWAFAHGMVSLELSDRFPPDADVEVLWERGQDALRTLLPEPAA